MGLSPAPLNFWWFSWLAIAPLWIVISQLCRNYREVACYGFIWGCGYHSLALFWITGVHPMTWMGVPWLASLLIAIAVWIVITFWGSLLVTFWSIAFYFLQQKIVQSYITKPFLGTIYKIIFGVTIWCCLETIWSHSPLWWSSLSYTQSPGNLAILQLTKISGYNTVTAAIVLVNGLLAEGIIATFWTQSDRENKKSLFLNKTKKISLILPVIIFISLHLWGFWLYQQPIVKDNLEPIKVGIIQGNIPNTIKLYSEGWKKAIQGYTTGYQRLAKQDVEIVLTPETALPFYWDRLVNNSELYRAIIATKVPIWVGAYGREGNSYTNSIFTITETGKTYSRYDKTILVPLGEYIPFEPIIGKIIDRLSPLEAHLQAGKPGQTLATPFGNAIIGICYESAFAEHFRRQTQQGGEFVITASNNAHYSPSMPAQHHAQDVIRAIESDRWAARATNTGYSAIVDPHGNTLWQSSINQYQIHAETIYRRKTKTLYVEWGDWLTTILLIISISIIALNVSILN